MWQQRVGHDWAIKAGWRAGIYHRYLFDIVTSVLSSLISAAFSSSYITFGTETRLLQDLLEGNCSLFVGICIPQEAFNRGTEADMGTSMKEDWGTITPEYSGHPKTKKRNLSSVEGAVPGCGTCREDAKQKESEGLKLHSHSLFSEALMD